MPLLLDAHIAPELLRGLLETYRPAFVHVPGDPPGGEAGGCWRALSRRWRWRTAFRSAPAGRGRSSTPELALLLTTSGSTGSPKLVRLSGRNLDANTRSIVEYLELDEGQRPVTNLAMSYSYGMSIVNTTCWRGRHWCSPGAACWSGPSGSWWAGAGHPLLAGVPYTYRMYRRAGLLEMELPALNTLTQAGGKLPRPFTWSLPTGRRGRDGAFFVMYGQTEAAPVWATCPRERAVEKCGSMGCGARRSVPPAGEDGVPIDAPDTVGELVYRGPNWPWLRPAGGVSWPWGTSGTGSSTPAIWPGRTGDGFTTSWAARSGLSSSTANRVGLDEVERLLAALFPDTGFACGGGG